MNPNSTSGDLAVVYRRVSTDHQDNSMELQEHLNAQYCQRLGLVALDRTYEDPDVSGSVWFRERAGGQALLARLQSGDVKHLVTAKQDRLGRDTLDTIATIRIVWELGIIPHFTAEGGAFPRTAQNELLFEIKASVAQYERNLIRDRTRAVMRHKFNQGQLTGNVPFGFDCVYTFTDGSTLVSAKALSLDPESRNFCPELAQRGRIVSKLLADNPSEQAVIHQMRAWRDQGWKLEQIAEELNGRGITSKFGCLWQAGNVASVLASRHTARVLGTAQPISQAA
ncbi:MAG TPA: recombinase family protein [Candidatus Acidoferrum sp.]|nr:recombinase family protein [Candidatus Acidoferrum sp.]